MMCFDLGSKAGCRRVVAGVGRFPDALPEFSWMGADGPDAPWCEETSGNDLREEARFDTTMAFKPGGLPA
jgi:hypothetical protein